MDVLLQAMVAFQHTTVYWAILSVLWSACFVTLTTLWVFSYAMGIPIVW